MKNAGEYALSNWKSLCREGPEHAWSTCVAYSHQMLSTGLLWPPPHTRKRGSQVGGGLFGPPRC